MKKEIRFAKEEVMQLIYTLKECHINTANLIDQTGDEDMYFGDMDLIAYWIDHLECKSGLKKFN